ncbi:hypothetical protein GGS26DRAFT_485222 [Hypomontagnella submonticulosa]|nr:hypothetical protein GGS26DRAFT_485222 [Hypomontagnella submonticulosa]
MGEGAASNLATGQTGIPVGSIVGGTVGAVVAVILITSFLLLYRRRRVAARSETCSTVDSLMEVSQPPWGPYKNPSNTTFIQETPNPAPTSLFTHGPILDGQYIYYPTPSIPYSNDLETGNSRHPKHHPHQTPIAELEGSSRFLYTPGQQYHELDSRPLPQPRAPPPATSRPAQRLPAEVT